MRTNLALFISLYSVSMPALSQDANLPLTDDAWINGNNAGTNYGADSKMFVHDFGSKQGLVRFDAGVISGTTVQSATLTVFLRDIRDPGQVSVYAVNSTWNEGSVTFNTQPSTGGAALDTASITPADEGSSISFDVTATAQQWAAGTLANSGLSIQTTSGIRGLFDSKERSAGTPASLFVVFDGTGPPPPPPPPPPGSGPGVGAVPTVLDLSSPPIVIDQPGHYVLNQNWSFDNLPSDSTIIDLQAIATIDLQGFEIATNEINTVVIQANNFGWIMNGRIVADGEGSSGIVSTTGVRVQNIRVSGNEDGVGIDLDGVSTVINIEISEGGIRLDGDESTLMSSELGCVEPCVIVRGNNSTISGNKIFQFEGTRVVSLEGDGNTFSHNTVEFDDPQVGVLVSGNNNLVFSNTINPLPTIPASGYDGVPIRVSGTGNILKDNILPPKSFEVDTGIQFQQDGNFYRNNQISATVPFDLGGTTQTDMGGNVAF